ncbi:hypothetical protein Pmani_032880 [Petrolisthes manimaculis]|uniref:Uncharacterized protein n=1 Tax=Petrolisthes manimaculis TaxID=1843537 RepID=A0AAE1NQU6_9EUCA|nr:hypothetical protein Pmani_032878 [Petrolisthes manimaculis]KAK4294497.1 hypothetical protein Pmani_032880 [Petrolisthes manimaculis]
MNQYYELGTSNLSYFPRPRRQYRLISMEQHTLEPELPLPPYPEPGVSSYKELSYDYPPPPSRIKSQVKNIPHLRHPTTTAE